jgi:hypothetical protein
MTALVESWIKLCWKDPDLLRHCLTFFHHAMLPLYVQSALVQGTSLLAIRLLIQYDVVGGRPWMAMARIVGEPGMEE